MAVTWTRWRHQVAWSLATRPGLYLPLARLGLMGSDRRRCEPVRRSTEIVIEGFPRCANTFSVAAFRLAQGRPVRIAHHLHSPAQVLAAVRWQVPTMLLVREPVAATASYAVRNRDLPLATILDEYRRFYTLLEPVRDQVVVARFSDVVNDFGAVIDRVNERYGTSFAPFEHTDENLVQCFVPPSSEAQQRKLECLETLGSAEFADDVAEARAVYAEYASSQRIHAPCV
jgi:hypothetical protein